MQDKKNGFSAIEVAIVIAVLSIFSAVAIPAFNCVRRRAISTAAQETIRQIKEECETNYIYGIDKFTSSNPDKYQISASGSNSCSGGTVTLTPEDTNLYPTYIYKFADSELSYNFKGQTGTSFVACNKLICSVGKSVPEVDPNKCTDPNISKDGYYIDVNKRCDVHKTGDFSKVLVYGGTTCHSWGIPGCTNWNHKWCSCDRPCDQWGQYYTCGDYDDWWKDLKSFCEVSGYGKGVFCD